MYGYFQLRQNLCCISRRCFRSNGQAVAQSRFLHMSSIEDVPENLPSTFPTGLTLSQQLLFRRYVEEVKSMTPAQCQSMIVELVKQTMLKDNIMRSLLKQPEVSLTSQLPSPEEFQYWDGDPYELDISGDMIEPWPGFDPDTLKRKAEEENEKQDKSLYPDWTKEATPDEED
ncbi:hypothetical protein Gasu2_21180 [Galdieria sulphuraria]|nr:hypothetical protein Gasu2_21180 [Galdieria sulphuraria]